MPDTLFSFLRLVLPSELSVALAGRLADLEQGRFEQILSDPLTRQLLGHDVISNNENREFDAFSRSWNDYIFDRAGRLLARRTPDGNGEAESPEYRQHFFLLVAIAALQAFVQSNVTGPPLDFVSSKLLFPESVSSEQRALATVRDSLVKSLNVDGEAAYKLTPHIELLCLADTILICPPIRKNVKVAAWVKLRKDFIHQRLLSEIAPTLQTSIYEALEDVNDLLESHKENPAYHDLHSQFLLEQATIHVHHGLDKQARQVLGEASKERGFQCALTGVLGKRTKWQERDTSQLVVLARSNLTNGGQNSNFGNGMTGRSLGGTKPESLDLNDDTLLEAISFSQKDEAVAEVQDKSTLLSTLSSLDPADQPLLHPVDSIILLLLASAITNTSPADGLTREETLPYATRVLEGGSSNWQVYTQALLVRSRIEGYRSRTTERGLLQLQALVDQVIAETTSSDNGADATSSDGKTTLFLPRAKENESAPVSERLQYIYELCPPTRWELEAELAARWVSLGGLRSALEIYERLEMWPEAALCWAAVEREDRAKKILRRQLFHATNGVPEDEIDKDDEKWEGDVRDPPPADAPRLYCILGDMDNDTALWEKAWEVSNQRYGRAQRSLGRHYFAANDHVKAASAYAKALKINQLNQSSWFALGCCYLELGHMDKAIETFSRTVQLDDTDAEAWSNLAAALLHKAAESPVEEDLAEPVSDLEEDGAMSRRMSSPQQNRRDALQALKRAAMLKRDNSRIWDNLLTVAASLNPPAYADIIIAQTRIIDLRGANEGEKCVDVPILEHLVRHVITTHPSLDATTTDDESSTTLETDFYEQQDPVDARGLPRFLTQLLNTKIIPLITTSARLWQLVATVALWRKDPVGALEAHEKGWRAVTSQPGWEGGTEEQWNGVVDATIDLCDAYETFDEEAGGKGKFKARSAVRSIMGKGRASWEETEGWEKLTDRLQGLKN